MNTMLPVVLRNSAFSLIEITFSLCLATFCMVPLVGLMTISTDTGRDSELRSAAIGVVRQVVTSIRNAKPSSTGQYTTAKPDQCSWRADGSPLSPISGTVDATGSKTGPAVFAYYLEMTPPDEANPDSLGHAIIRLSWPATATWNHTHWENASGTEEALILFRAQ